MRRLAKRSLLRMARLAEASAPVTDKAVAERGKTIGALLTALDESYAEIDRLRAREPELGKVDITRLAERMERLIRKRRTKLRVPLDHPEHGVNHLSYMCRHVYNGFVSGGKALLWLGFVHGVMNLGGGASLNELMRMTEAASGRKLTYKK